MSISNWFVGGKVDKMIKKLRIDDPIKVEFYKCLRASYELGGCYIQQKFPLNNSTLKALSSIDPICNGSAAASTTMKRLKLRFPTVISESEHDQFDLEVNDYHLSTNLPTINKTDGCAKCLDEWWSEVFEMKRFPVLEKVIKACLSIFTGPMIEQSFSAMNNIINKKTNRLNVETFSAIQSIRYDLKSTQQDTFSRYRRINFLRSPINRPLCRKMSLSYKTYSEKLEKLRNKRKKSREDLGVKTVAKKKRISVHHRAEKVMQQVLNPKQK